MSLCGLDTYTFLTSRSDCLPYTEESIILFGIPIGLYVISTMSAFLCFFVVYQKQMKIKIIRRIFSKYEKAPWAISLDAVIISVLGAIICTVVMQPADYQHSAIYGLGWSGLLNRFGTSLKKIDIE